MQRSKITELLLNLGSTRYIIFEISHNLVTVQIVFMLEYLWIMWRYWYYLRCLQAMFLKMKVKT